MNYVGRILEFQLEPDGRRSAHIGCEAAANPAPGQYLLAQNPAEPDEVLANVIFPKQKTESGFFTAAPLPAAWFLGAEIRLSGPMGKGFRLPPQVRNLALAALGDTANRLLPLLAAAENIALFTDLQALSLPPHVEVQPLHALPEARAWADYLVLDLGWAQLEAAAALLDQGERRFPHPVYALIDIPMPCGGLADCGVCAIRAKRGYHLACQDGPVFDWGDIRP